MVVKATRQSLAERGVLIHELDEHLTFLNSVSSRALDEFLDTLELELKHALEKRRDAELAHRACQQSKDASCTDTWADVVKTDRQCTCLQELIREVRYAVDAYQRSLRDVLSFYDASVRSSVIRFQALNQLLDSLQISNLGSASNGETMARTAWPVSSQDRPSADGRPAAVGSLTALAPHADPSIVWLDVESLPDPDWVTGVNSFHKYSSEEVSSGLRKLAQMEVEVKGDPSKGRDYWSERDRAVGLAYEDSFRRTYDTFFGDESILVYQTGASYDIVNGGHRIWLAKRMGIRTLPVRMRKAA